MHKNINRLDGSKILSEIGKKYKLEHLIILGIAKDGTHSAQWHRNENEMSPVLDDDNMKSMEAAFLMLISNGVYEKSKAL